MPTSIVTAGGAEIPRSEPITSVLRQPLSPEHLSLSANEDKIVIRGPTYKYTVDRGSGVIEALEVYRSRQAIVLLRAPAEIQVDDYRLAPKTALGKTDIESKSLQKVVLKTTGDLLPHAAAGPRLPYTLTSTFFNDGVVVSELTLLPAGDIFLKRGIRHDLDLEGVFQWYLQKDHAHLSGEHLNLPTVGNQVVFAGSTSCLEVLSHEAAVAMFTDLGGKYISPQAFETASLRVIEKTGDRARVALTQHIVSVGPLGEPYLLAGGRGFRFRFGVSVAPNRHPHPRSADLRQFVWIGDGKYPYPSDEEIEQVARLGFTVFQMHRLGLLGQPRPPVHELERVIKKVHDAGMLFVWATSPDLIDSHSQRVQQMRAAGDWRLWEGFAYDGRYVAKMDPYCDTFGICIGGPNGLDDYHIACATQMMDKYEVDGIYLDDNITRGGFCRNWQMHGHPREGYDCLIELHEVNWRRRQVLLERCPHALLIDHCAAGLILPVISDFDVHLYGEGTGSSTLPAYWNFYGSIRNMDAHGNIWPGDTENSRFGAAAAYNIDLLTGGGQYCYLDWRLFPNKFPYAAGVTTDEAVFVRTFNLAQYFFGMYESKPYYFATSQDLFSTTRPNTFATIYRNQVWNDYLVPIANMDAAPVKDSLVIHAGYRIGLEDAKEYAIFDILGRSYTTASGAGINKTFQDLVIPVQSLRLFYLRPMVGAAPFHLWGGKRLEEHWNKESRRLTIKLLGPAGLKDDVLIAVNGQRITSVVVNGQKAEFLLDGGHAVAHGPIEFSQEPLIVEATFGTESEATLPEGKLQPQSLAEIYGRKSQK